MGPGFRSTSTHIVKDKENIKKTSNNELLKRCLLVFVEYVDDDMLDVNICF